MPHPPLAVLNCSQLVTLAGPDRARSGDEMSALQIIPDGALTVRDGRIEHVGPRTAIEPLLTSAHTVVDAQRRAVLPGFVDAHTHPVFAGNRVGEWEQRSRGVTYSEIAAAGGGIRYTVRQTRAADAGSLFESSRRRLALCLRNGTTTVEAKSGYGLSPEAELTILEVIARLNHEGPLRCVPTFLGAHEIPDEFRGDPEAYGDLVINEMLPAVAARRLAEYCDIFCEPGIFPVEAARRILEAARKHGFALRLHAEQLNHSGAALLAAELGAATADHLEQIDSAGIRALAAAQVQPVLLPAAAYTLGSHGFAPARAMIDAGLAVVLATDFNPGSSPTPSIPFVLSLASTQLRMSPAEALTAVTVNAAHSLGRGHAIGSLEPGKLADFVIHDCEDYREIGYHAGVESAATVFIDGVMRFDRHG